jgi:hypothetical protein
MQSNTFLDFFNPPVMPLDEVIEAVAGADAVPSMMSEDLWRCSAAEEGMDSRYATGQSCMQQAAEWWQKSYGILICHSQARYVFHFHFVISSFLSSVV